VWPALHTATAPRGQQQQQQQARQWPRSPSPQPHVVALPLTLEELYCGATKRLKVGLAAVRGAWRVCQTSSGSHDATTMVMLGWHGCCGV
jgi:hypothetical protein